MEMADKENLQKLFNLLDKTGSLLTNRDVMDMAIILNRAVVRKIGEELEC